MGGFQAVPVPGITPIDQVAQAQMVAEAESRKALIEFIEAVITEVEDSPNFKYMAVAQRYYENKSDIMEKKRTVISADMNNEITLKESKVLANNKLPHNFMKKLTRQKLGYMLGKPFSLVPMKADDEKAKKFFDIMTDRYLDLAFYRLLKNTGRDSIVKGLGWMMPYYNEKGKLCLRRCGPEEVMPLWADEDHTDLEAIIRKYKVEVYEGSKKSFITHVEYWTNQGVEYFIKSETDGHLKHDPEHPKMEPHFWVLTDKKDEETGEPIKQGVNWSVIPFIPFKYDPDEQSLLVRIKELVDDYDRKTSEISDAIADHPNAVTVIKNYDGESKEEFVKNKNEYRTIFVSGDGEANTLEAPLNVSEMDKHIQRLREDIFEFGQGVNTADKDIRDTSGVALRFLYADLDMDCVDWGAEVKWSLHRLFWFIQYDILAHGGEDFTDVQYDIVFNTDVIINETETVTNAMNSKGLISDKTIAANHPWVIDAEKEIADMMTETEDTLDLEADYAKKVAAAKHTGSGGGAGSGGNE